MRKLLIVVGPAAEEIHQALPDSESRTGPAWSVRCYLEPHPEGAWLRMPIAGSWKLENGRKQVEVA